MSPVSNLRLIARLDIKGPNLIKGIQMEGLRVIGSPQVFARRYYDQGADEILYMDTVASLYGRDTMLDIVRHTAEEVFVPITVGGGLRSIQDVQTMLRAGADKIAMNTAATLAPDIISEIARRFGAQCMVLQIDAKKVAPGKWEVYRDGGREHTGLDVVEWAKQGENLGAGEILLTSVDRDGTYRGYDTALIKAVSSAVRIPVIASGGMGTIQHLFEAVDMGCADAVAMARILHYDKISLPEIRRQAQARSMPVRCMAS